MPLSGNDLNRRQTLKAMGASITGLTLAGCMGDGGDGGGGGDGGDGGDGGGGDGSDGGGGGTATSQPELTEFPLITPHFGFWNSTIPYVVGQEQNFFENEGLTVSRVSTEGGGSNIRALVSGDARAAYATGTAGLFAAYRENAGVHIVANEFNRSQDMFFYALADSEYESADDLSGATIGFSSPGSSTNMVAATAAGAHEGAEAVSAGGPPDANAALEGGQVDLAWAVPPLFLEQINAGDYKVVFRGSDIEPFDNLSIRCNFAARQDMEENLSDHQAYWAAHKNAIDWAYDNLDEAVRLWGEASDRDNYDILTQAVNNGFPREAMALDEFVGLDEANQIAVDFDFIDDTLSQDELNDLINTAALPMTDGDTF